MEAITDHRPEALDEFYSRHGSRLKSVIGNVVHEELYVQLQTINRNAAQKTAARDGRDIPQPVKLFDPLFAVTHVIDEVIGLDLVSD